MLLNCIAFGLVLKASNSQKLYVRNSLFATVVDDNQAPNEATLNGLLAASRVEDNPNLNAGTIFTAAQQNNLREIVSRSRSLQCQAPGDHSKTSLTATDCLARLLAADISPYMIGGQCGLDGSLKSRIGQIIRGQGCCSDYTDAFMMRAKATGLKAREVHFLGHTTAKYFDREQGRWKLIDTSLRSQISDPDGRLLSAYELSRRFPWQALTMVKLPPLDKGVNDNKNFSPYLNVNNSVLYWTRGNNLIEQERFELPLAKLGLPKEAIQLASLTLGVRPGWLVLAPPEAAFRFRLSAILLKSAISLFVLLNALLLLAAAWGWRQGRQPKAIDLPPKDDQPKQKMLNQTNRSFFRS